MKEKEAADHVGRHPGRRQSKCPDRRRAGTAPRAGLQLFEKHAISTGAHPRTRRTRQRLWRLRTLTITQDITAYTKASLFAQVGKKTPASSAFRPSPVNGARPTPSGRPRLRDEVLHRPRKLGPCRQQHAGLLRADPYKFPDFIRTQKRDRRPTCAATRRCGLLVAFAGEPAPGDDSVFRTGSAAQFSEHERLRQPHLQPDQRQERTGLGEIPFQDHAGNQDDHRRGNPRRSYHRIAKAISATCSTPSPQVISRNGG